MTIKELINILHNIPKDIFQSKNHKELHIIIHCGMPWLSAFNHKNLEILKLTLYKTMQYRICTTTKYTDIENQVKSYLNILGFTEKPPNSSAHYTPKLRVAINSTITDTEIMKLKQLELRLQK